MAWTRLQLINKAIIECGVTGGPLTTAVGVTTGGLGRICGWIDDSWQDVQTEHDDWDWMRSSNILGKGVSFVPTAGQFNIPLGTGAGCVGVAVDSFGKWDLDTARCYVTSVGTSSELFIDKISFDVWRDDYMFGAMRNVETRPVSICEGPDLSLNVGPPSNGLYTITCDYFVAPSAMVADTDSPNGLGGLPSRFSLLIVYGAMMKYAGYESAPEVYSRGMQEYNRLFAELEARQLPPMEFAGSLDA